MMFQGHSAAECTSKRVFDKSKIADIEADKAWDNFRTADDTGELDEIRPVSLRNRSECLSLIVVKAFQIYTKAAPDATYAELEQSFRMNDMRLHLIATASHATLPSFTQKI